MMSPLWIIGRHSVFLGVENRYMMKKAFLFISALLVLAACKNGSVVQTEVREYADSTSHAFLKMHAELPLPSDAVSSAIRSSLIDVMDGQLSQVSYGEPQRYFPRFDGDAGDTDALLSYYEQQTMKQIAQLSQEDADEREFLIRENDELTAEEREEMLVGFPSWEYDFNLRKVADTLNYVVFLSENYVYMGGAHGGVTGGGYLTYDKKSGSLVEKMLDPACVTDIQPVLVRGLMRYYSEVGAEMPEEEMLEHLQVEGGIIPLPAWTPYPTKEGLVFVYQQYEIASYADGMPSFTVPYAEIKPWLTAEAKSVLSSYRF